MGEAALRDLKALGHCDGSRLWLGPFTKEACGETNRLLIRSASNAYFSQLMSVISLPDRNEALAKAVDHVWEFFLQYVETLEQLQDEQRRKSPVREALKDFTDEEVFEEIRSRRIGGGHGAGKSVKQAELETLLTSQEEIGRDRPEGTFYVRALPKAQWAQPWMRGVERVALVHRLREVVAQVGVTRFEAAAPDVEGELEIGVRRAAFARETSCEQHNDFLDRALLVPTVYPTGSAFFPQGPR